MHIVCIAAQIVDAHLNHAKFNDILFTKVNIMGKSEIIEISQLKMEFSNLENHQLCIVAFIDKLVMLVNLMKECQRSYKQTSDILIHDLARNDFSFNDFFLE